MTISWLRNRRRAELRRLPFPAEWEAFLQADVAIWPYLTESERERLRGDLRIFLTEKTWEGARGAAVDDRVRVVIAAQACLLLLGWARPHLFPNVSSVIVYPAVYRVRTTDRSGYVESVSRAHRLGEAWGGDLPVILSWRDTLAASRDEADGHNVVLHEFAHKLDMMGGGAAGVPPLEGGDPAYEHWARVMSAEYAALRRASYWGPEPVLDRYGATSEAEFFAVATEAFFERPLHLLQERPQLYALLRDYYCQDTAARGRPEPFPPEEPGEPVAIAIQPLILSSGDGG